MKITQYRNDDKTNTQRVISMETALASMTTEIKARPVTFMREALLRARPGEQCDFVQKIPTMVFGGTFKREGGNQVMTSYNGLVALDIQRLANQKEARELRDLAAVLPQTYLAFVGSSGKSVKILVPFTLMDGTLPQSADQIKLFHAQAYREAVKWYQPQLNMDIELRKPGPDNAIRMTFDPTLYYNPEATAIRIEQPLRMPEEKPSFNEALQTESDPLMRLLPGYERYHVISILFDTSLFDAINQINGIDNEHDLHPFFTKLAENCFKSGIPQEDAIRFTLTQWELKKYELVIRTKFRNAYTLGKMFGKKPCITSTMTLAVQLDDFMKRRYQLRRNTIKGIVEYRELKSFNFDFRPMTKEAMNGMTLNAITEGISAWDADVKRHVESDRVYIYNPIEEYLSSLPAWDGKDHIRALANRIKCSNTRWTDQFYTWFLSMVAHWQQKDKEHANSTLPLLVGDQGCGKSTFCMNILPPELREYYTDSIDFSKRRDVELALNRFALINMDEFDSISPSYRGFMKHIIQKAVVQSRRPHGSATEQLRRYATFIATSNNFDLLTDPTGSRRFICVEVEGTIDYKQPIDYKQLYAQAVRAIQQGDQYWFTPEEEAYITTSNQRFQYTMPEEEAVYTYFRSPVNGERFEELTCTELLERVGQRRKGVKYTRTVASRLGRALKCKFKSRRAHKGMVYEVVEMK